MTATATATHPLEALDLTPRCETIMDGVAEHGAPATHSCTAHNKHCEESFAYICGACLANIRARFAGHDDIVCRKCELTGPLETFIRDIRSIT